VIRVEKNMANLLSILTCGVFGTSSKKTKASNSPYAQKTRHGSHHSLPSIGGRHAEPDIDYRIRDSDVAVTRSNISLALEQTRTSPSPYDDDFHPAPRIGGRTDGVLDNEREGKLRQEERRARSFNVHESEFQSSSPPVDYPIILDGSLSPGFVPAVN
jgi:hypothetical protein